MIKNANWNECHLNEQSAYSSCFTPIYPAAPLCRGAGFAFFKGNVSGRKNSGPDAVKTGGQACMIK